MKRLLTLAASAAIAASTLVPVAAQAAAEPVGTTSMRFSYGVTETLLQNNVLVAGQSPAGGTILTPGKVALEMPIASVKGSKYLHEGELFFSHSGSMGWRTVVISGVQLNLASDSVKGVVYATDTVLGTKEIFTVKHVKKSSGGTSYTLVLAPGAAALLNSSLGTWVFKEGMRVGTGYTMENPPS